MEPDRRLSIGRLGEACAAWYLARRGVEILGRNIVLAGGEIDILAGSEGLRVLVEVRTVSGRAHPDDLFPRRKREQLRRLAVRARCGRIDLIGVQLSEWGFSVDWVQGLE